MCMNEAVHFQKTNAFYDIEFHCKMERKAEMAVECLWASKLAESSKEWHYS